MKKIFSQFLLSSLLGIPLTAIAAVSPGNIEKVTIYQNQARVERSVEVSLKRGDQEIVIEGLPSMLLDATVRANPQKTRQQSRIQSLQVEKKALLEKKQKRIRELETELDALYQKDYDLLDKLSVVHNEIEFLDTIRSDQGTTNSDNARSGTLSLKSMEATLTFLRTREQKLLGEKRDIERSRDELNRKIQVVEHELQQVGGQRYFSQYSGLRTKMNESNRLLKAQEQISSYNYYNQKKALLQSSDGLIDEEKRLVVQVNSPVEQKAKLYYSYIVPSTSWNMVYDLRADPSKKTIELSVYSLLRQKTGEDWNDARITLSTAQPVTRLSEPWLPAWILDVYQPYRNKSKSSGASRSVASAVYDAEESFAEIKAEEDQIQQVQLNQTGESVEITLPGRIDIPSSEREQRNFVKTFEIKNVEYYYDIVPQSGQPALLRAKFINQKELPLLPGSAEFYVDDEFTARENLPLIQPGVEGKVMLASVEKLQGRKVLLKKYEDDKGIFGDKRRIRYRYRLELTNFLDRRAELLVRDTIPVSRNEKIQVEMENASVPPIDTKAEKQRTEWEKGERRFRLNLAPGEKKHIDYDVVITFDKDLSISGLR